MSKEAIVERILSDARAEAQSILEEAEAKAEAVRAEARKRAEVEELANEMEVKTKAKDIFDGKSASARLDGAKALLGEKRRVIDAVYSLALEKLSGSAKTGSLRFAESLLQEHAETGDEVVFSPDYRYKADVAKLPVVKEKKLKVSPKEADIAGGFVLQGKNSDKDLSYSTLLALDREENQAELAAKIFKTG